MTGVELERNCLKVHQEKEKEENNDLDIGEEDRPLSGISVNIICPKNEEKNKPACIQVKVKKHVFISKMLCVRVQDNEPNNKQKVKDKKIPNKRYDWYILGVLHRLNRTGCCKGILIFINR